MLIDTHAHVNFSAFKDDAEATIKRALEAGILVVNVGTQIDTSREAVEMAEKFERYVYAVIGIHPVHTYQQMLDEEDSHFQTRAEVFNHGDYFKLGQSPKVVGIGECGLDYYRLPAEGDIAGIKKSQKETFIAQIRLAKELDKALVIHCRPSKDSQDAYEDILAILDSEAGQQTAGGPDRSVGADSRQLRFEIHSFTSSPEIVQEFLKRGAFVGLNGIITFDKTGNMEQVVKAVPIDRIVLETDSPYLTPAPHRGKRNEPSYVKFVADKLIEFKGMSFEEIAEQTSKNAKKLFKI